MLGLCPLTPAESHCTQTVLSVGGRGGNLSLVWGPFESLSTKCDAGSCPTVAGGVHQALGLSEDPLSSGSGDKHGRLIHA